MRSARVAAIVGEEAPAAEAVSEGLREAVEREDGAVDEGGDEEDGRSLGTTALSLSLSLPAALRSSHRSADAPSTSVARTALPSRSSPLVVVLSMSSALCPFHPYLYPAITVMLIAAPPAFALNIHVLTAGLTNPHSFIPQLLIN